MCWVSHPVEHESSDGGGFFHWIPFLFPSPGLWWFLYIRIKSLPESPSLTQLPAILRGRIEFLGYSREYLLKAVCSRCQPVEFHEARPRFFSSYWEHGCMRIVGIIESDCKMSDPLLEPKAMSTRFIVPV